jgi:hypothetical protein
MKGSEEGDETIDTEALDKAGSGGMFLVALGLVWWGEKIEEIGRRLDVTGSWLTSVREVAGVLDSLRDWHQAEKAEGASAKAADGPSTGPGK